MEGFLLARNKSLKFIPYANVPLINRIKDDIVDVETALQAINDFFDDPVPIQSDPNQHEYVFLCC
jgi:hypothetical protein